MAERWLPPSLPRLEHVLPLAAGAALTAQAPSEAALEALRRTFTSDTWRVLSSSSFGDTRHCLELVRVQLNDSIGADGLPVQACFVVAIDLHEGGREPAVEDVRTVVHVLQNASWADIDRLSNDATPTMQEQTYESLCRRIDELKDERDDLRRRLEGGSDR